jgi:N-hydroxyarylamine O-acetyltransferase
MLLRVRLDEGDYLADVGFGGLTLTAPLALASRVPQETPHEPHRLVALDEENELALEVRLGEGWTRLYEFTLQRQWPIDYELANWFTATHPGSLFTTNLLAARPMPDRRYGLLNDALTIRHRDGRVEQSRLDGPQALGDALSQHFGIALGDDEVARVAAAIAARPPQ